MSKERQIVEYSQSSPQDTKVQAIGSLNTEKTQGDPSQTKTTQTRSDEGKEIAEHTPSSSLRRPLAEHTPRWLQKEVIRSSRPKF